jgi:hypothetical protein
MGEKVTIDGEEYELPEGVTLAKEGGEVQARIERSRRIAQAIAELGPRATQQAIAERAGVDVRAVRRRGFRPGSRGV